MLFEAHTEIASLGRVIVLIDVEGKLLERKGVNLLLRQRHPHLQYTPNGTPPIPCAVWIAEIRRRSDVCAILT